MVATDAHRHPPVECGVASRAFPGEAVLGDAHVIRPFLGGTLFAAVDGIGHGPGASEAASRAVATLEQHAHEPAPSLMRRCHDALRPTRGAAITIASLTFADRTLTWLGVGNVEGVLVREDGLPGGRRERLTLRSGVVGFRLPPLRATAVEVSVGDVLILATDGIRERFTDVAPLDAPPRQIAQRILNGFGTRFDDELVLVARYVGP